MKFFYKPKIILSKCLNGKKCRYDGEAASSKFVTRLKPFIDIYEICPEEGIGLKTPRNAIRLIQDIKTDKVKLIDPKTFKDYTSLMTEFSEESLGEIKIFKPNGCILKSKSPSCGLKDVKIYNGPDKGAQSKKGSGIYSSFLKNHFPLVPIEEDGRLNNFLIREQFLTKIFILSEFDSIKFSNEIEPLIKFHTKHKLLFMTYSQNITKKLGKLIASNTTINKQTIYLLYEIELLKLTLRTPRYTTTINTINHAFRHFSKYLKREEKDFFISLIEEYRNGVTPLCVLINVLKGYAIRFENKYLLNQSFLEPFPRKLMDLSDSGKGIVRDK